MMFIGSRHCPHCGAAAAQASAAELSILQCPRCRTDMSSVTIGAEAMRECERCGGLWVEVAVFDRICADREKQSIVLGGASLALGHQPADGVEATNIRYVPCPQCGNLMNRINFSKCSGVIIDVCRGHGTWFDRDELSQIVQFIRDGGLDLARQRERHEIEFQREQLRTEQMLARPSSELLGISFAEHEKVTGISAARGLLKFLLK
jgi:Zn-finger nucleic acid-binding protein